LYRKDWKEGKTTTQKNTHPSQKKSSDNSHKIAANKILEGKPHRRYLNKGIYQVLVEGPGLFRTI
jgi:hypothetical protein